LSQDVAKYKLGLYFALRFYLTMQQQQQQQPPGKPSSSSGGGVGATGLAPRPSVGGFARSEGIGAEPQQLEQWLLSLVLGYAAATLSDVAATATTATTASATTVPAAIKGSNSSVTRPDGVTQSHDSSSEGVPAAVAAAAEKCVCVCLLLGRPDVLFGRVFQLFAQQGSVSGGLGALLEVVELAVLSDLLHGLAPEVMQVRGWFRLFGWARRASHLEACVCWGGGGDGNQTKDSTIQAS
jgi:hypothetical protein